MKINQANSQLQLQVEESKRDLNDKTRKLIELDELIAVLKDQKEIFKQEKRRDAEEDRKTIKELTDDIRYLTKQNTTLNIRVQEQSSLLDDIQHDYQNL